MINSWNEELIEKRILEVANTFFPIRMPTCSEMENFYGNSALTNKIIKTGGIAYWANKLNLEQKHSETLVGIRGEHDISQHLIGLGYEVEATKTRFPYDLLVDGCVKIDVKTSNKSYIRGSEVHAYRLAKEQQTCDFYVFYELDTGRKYVVPAHKCRQIQVEIGKDSIKYGEYENAFHLIGEVRDLFRML